MAKNKLSQEELELLIKLLNNNIELLERQIQADESLLQNKGNNAILKIKISVAKTL